MATRCCKSLLSFRKSLVPLEQFASCTNTPALDAANKNLVTLRGFCGIRRCDFGCPQLKNSGLFSNQPAFPAFQSRGLKAAPKQMEVILTADLNKVGKAGDVVKVAKGYARNMLIPQLLALPKLEKYVNLVQRQLEAVKLEHPEDEAVEEVQESKTEEQRLKELNALLNRMETQRVVIRGHTPRRSNSLHKQITPEDIVAEVKRQQKIQIQEINLEMSSYITTLGEFEIPIRLPKTIQIPSGKAKIFLKVKVRRS